MLVQPLLPRTVRWVVAVVQTPQGPLALTPTEAEVVDVEDDVLSMHLEMEMWHGKQQVCNRCNGGIIYCTYACLVEVVCNVF